MMKSSIEYVTLGNISEDIVTGMVIARKKSKDENGYPYKIFTLRSFNENGYLEKEYLDEFISTEKLDNRQISKEGDIIVRLSYPNTAIYVTKELEGMLVPSLFVIIRIHINHILNNYVQIYLNSDEVKKQLMPDTIGSAIPIVKTSSFKDIRIPIYSLEYQKKIIDMNKMILKEKGLLNKLIEEKTLYHKGIMKKLFEYKSEE
ncbi:restriction endonuclease subunit S [Clostridium beijerinckii]|uniref:restriction endonuclease subunit S n=1 Tax=Clostridium beijerinckii TaxID=1520 RepID=UPI001360B7D0|nr:restriction endonuclease subunit S [Clostridium beijerinckii]MZK52054.1 restriction endonuclease subunit S [Clostridium beijerinckii]MZK60195.1 restriction endonuclease subunit S [Clostridium beijerinckii]MZK70480.1 restriction endonuclease subunit S [Clostridium beijerinckii]MZK75782.1 restriction endonuclease subunit S [Clostridium beijerinckii]MZK85446.1 restriction endonuclease subunit S [Clostridium beijerinckii]